MAHRTTALALAIVLAAACSPDEDDTVDEAATGPVTREQVDAGLSAIDGFVRAEMDSTGVPGVAVAVVYDDEVVLAEGYGVREVGTTDAVSADTVFRSRRSPSR